MQFGLVDAILRALRTRTRRQPKTVTPVMWLSHDHKVLDVLGLALIRLTP
jgi:hypothetical protein